MSNCNYLTKLAVVILTSLAVSQSAFAQPPGGFDPQVITIDYSTAPQFLWDEFAEAQEMFNERFAGYRADVPRALLAELRGVRIAVGFDFVDGLFGILAFAGPVDIATYEMVTPVFYNQHRRYAFTQTGEMTIDIDDIELMLAEEIFVEVVVHEAMHAIGFGTLFEANGLNGVTNFFGQRNYTFDGFALGKYREEAQVPFAQFIPLNQQDGGGHWNPFDPFFDQTQNGLRDIMHPFAPPPGVTTFISETTWSVFADLGYRIHEVNP